MQFHFISNHCHITFGVTSFSHVTLTVAVNMRSLNEQTGNQLLKNHLIWSWYPRAISQVISIKGNLFHEVQFRRFHAKLINLKCTMVWTVRFNTFDISFICLRLLTFWCPYYLISKDDVTKSAFAREKIEKTHNRKVKLIKKSPLSLKVNIAKILGT